MAIRLAAIDLDGTLLHDDMTVSEFSREVLQKAAEKIRIVVATGRMFDSASAKTRLLGLGDIPVICYTGAWAGLCESGKMLWQDGLSPELAEQILGDARREGWAVQSYIDDTVCMPGPSEMEEKYRKYRTKAPLYLGEDFYHPKKMATRLILVEADRAKKDAARKQLEAAYGNAVEVVYPGDDFLDIHKKGVSKAHALAVLGEKWGILPGEMAAFGNTENDVSMLRFAGASFAVSNAEPEALAAAKEILPRTNDEDAVAYKLKELLAL